MDRDQLIDAVVNALNVEDDPKAGITAAQLAESLGWSIDRARRALRQLVRAGQIEVVYVRQPRIDGVILPIPAYRLIEPEEESTETEDKEDGREAMVSE